MALSETKKVLINGLSITLTNKEVITAIALLLKSDYQMRVMRDDIYPYHQENP